MRLISDIKNDHFEPINFIQYTALNSLKRWSELNRSSLTAPTVYTPLTRHHSPYPYREDINGRFIVWEGDISLLNADCITNPTNERLNDRNSVSDRIVNRAGANLLDELKLIKVCRIGEVRVSKGHSLPARYLIHTVCPIYSQKNRTASIWAENTLQSCYRNVLNKAKELSLQTIGLCTISVAQRNFPSDLEAHIALRTIRKFLEVNKREIVILCLEQNECGLYEVLAPLYFPRNQLEETSALWQLPKNISNITGELSITDRQIRITRNPQHTIMMLGTDDDSDNNPHDFEGNNSDLETGNDDLLHFKGHNSFTQMQGDLDRQRLLGDRHRDGVYESVLEDGLEGIEHQERYERLLRRSRTEDLSEVSGIGCLYQSGFDRLGRPVIVFCGKWFPAHEIDLEKALLYLIQLLDPLVKGDYVIAYFHTLTSTNNYPSLNWLKEVYSILPYKYKKNLKAFYIVHPTFWTKMMTWWFTTFMAPAIKHKVHSLPGVEHLYSVICKDQLEIPAYISEYDMATNGLHYFQPFNSNAFAS
ncbi:CLUMA_CG016248, isoform B [Clunio marinus]|uniref:CLUMA_CG016248, isoform B n=1 Tax=Clunio marinus TaxID=568069 RepID=A0A1J1IUL5_9DIPT|nr:CLUMA_CG016248, isoform B [Clunio marinus]